MDATLHCPFTMLVCGASGSGKSFLTLKMLSCKDRVMSFAPEKIVWCYGAAGALPMNNISDNENIKNIEYHNGLPGIDLLEGGNMILIIDDLMQQAKGSGIVADIFTKYSHHNNITCICLLQNIFPKGSEIRNISLNSNYIVLMKNSRDLAQINHLARQMFPGRANCLTSAYQDATKEPFSYLMLDFRNTTNENMRVRSGIFPDECMYAYQFPKIYK